MRKINHPVLRLLTSYGLGIAMLLLMMLLLVLGTWYQRAHGLFRAKQIFFDSYVFLYPPGLGIGIPLPGARLLMVVLFVNLLCATCFRITYRRSIIGVYVIHAGILLLLGGGFLTAYLSHEGAMQIREGEVANYSTRFYEKEIVVTVAAGPNKEQVTVITNIEHLKPGTVLCTKGGDVPVTLVLETVFNDSRLVDDKNEIFAERYGLDHGVRVVGVVRAPAVGDDVVTLSAVVRAELDGGATKRFLLSDELINAVSLDVDGRTVQLRLRNVRDYYPFSVYLDDFIKRTHPGTDMASDYASEVVFMYPEKRIERHARIYMNHPLRYMDYTFFQASFSKDEKGTILQVVKNPGMPVPYISAAVIAVGLIIQFVTTLVSRRRSRMAMNEVPQFQTGH